MTEGNEKAKPVPATGSRDEMATNEGATTSSGFGLHPSRGSTPAIPARGGFGYGGWRGRGNWRANWGRGGRGNWGRGRGQGTFQGPQWSPALDANADAEERLCHEIEKDVLKVRMLKFQQRKTLEKHGGLMIQVRGRNSNKVLDLKLTS